MRKVGVGTFTVLSTMRDYIEQIFDSGRISYGPFSQRFEKEFAALHNTRYAILSNSGTSALHVALQALKTLNGWRDHDEVIVPMTTFVATSNIVLHNQLTPIFVDVEGDHYNINPHKIEAAISERTRAIIPVHLFGQAANMREILEIAKTYNLKVIEDSCEAMFVTHHGQPVGSMGDVGCFSTYVAHLITTGVGGLSLTNDEELAAMMRSLVNHGLEFSNLNPDANFAPQPMPGRRFRFSHIGHSFRVTELEAALGVAQLEMHQEMLRLRNRNAKHLTAGLTRLVNAQYGQPLQLPSVMEGNTHSWMMYPIVLNIDATTHFVDKEPLMAYLNERGIETRDMLPILGQSAYSWVDREEYPISNWIARSGFYVGCHQGLQMDDIQYVIDTFVSWYER